MQQTHTVDNQEIKSPEGQILLGSKISSVYGSTRLSVKSDCDLQLHFEGAVICPMNGWNPNSEHSGRLNKRVFKWQPSPVALPEHIFWLHLCSCWQIQISLLRSLSAPLAERRWTVPMCWSKVGKKARFFFLEGILSSYCWREKGEDCFKPSIGSWSYLCRGSAHLQWIQGCSELSGLTEGPLDHLKTPVTGWSGQGWWGGQALAVAPAQPHYWNRWRRSSAGRGSHQSG